MSIHMASPILSLSNDFDLLNMLTSTNPPARTSCNNQAAAGRYKRREAPLDPLLFAAAISSGPHVTRHHYHHHHTAPALDDLMPDTPTVAEASPKMPSALAPVDPPKPKYKSQQAPRSQRVKSEEHGKDNEQEDKENQRERKPLGSLSAGNILHPQRRPRGPSLLQNSFVASSTASSNGPLVIGAGPPPPSPFIRASSPQTLLTPHIRNLPPAPLQVQCMARTRIPTPHGPAFLHLYRNNKDDKEHLAFVIDPAQLEQEEQASSDVDPSRFIRSTSLNAKWSEDEAELDRLTRGAYVGRLSPTVHKASTPSQAASASTSSSSAALPPPLVRIHSECFTGETIGSMRCDCGEQLDEALRLISLSRRGAVIYLRQEGRGIGLLSKIRAYNLQDMGHDTVQANLLLGHGADERRYDIAAAIMRDLGLGGGVELLTNNPDKVGSLEREGVRVVKRRAMVPRSWQQQAHEHEHAHGGEDGAENQRHARIGGATLIGGGAAHGPELEKYLRTKVERMGHMLDMPPSYES